MKRILIILQLVITCSPALWAGQFQKLAFIDPYDYLKSLSVATPDGVLRGYFAQLDSLGITLTLTRADSFASYNNAGVKLWGQYNMRQFTVHRIDTDHSYELDYIVHAGHNIYAEAEAPSSDPQSLYGYWWTRSQGSAFSSIPGNPVDGYRYIPGTDVADTVLESHGGRFKLKYDRQDVFAVYGRFRLAAWDTVTMDTLCDIVLNYTSYSIPSRRIFSYTGRSFASTSPGQWKDFEVGPLDISSMDTIRVAIYWRGTDSLAIDQIALRDVFGKTLESLNTAQKDSAFLQYYSSIDTASHGRFCPGDEPTPSQFWGFKLFDESASKPENGPGHRVATALRGNAALYIHDLNLPEVIPDWYTIGSQHDTATVPSGGLTSIQDAYTALADTMEQYSNTVHSLGKPLWFFIQAGGVPRDVTPNELKVEAFLAVEHGCSGIGYFVYTQMFDTFPRREVEDEVVSEDDPVSHSPVGLYNLAEHFVSPEAQDAVVTFNGLVDWNPVTHHYDRNARWTAAQQAHQLIDSIWPTLEPLTWVNSVPWTEAASLGGYSVSRIRSLTFDSAQTWVDVSRFTSAQGDEYLMFLNRRSVAAHDSQDVRIDISNVPGRTTLHDVYKGVSYDAFDSCGTAEFTMSFAPSELRLFKVTHMETFKGAWTGIWPQYSTIKLAGDITVPQGDTLKVRTSNLTAMANTDSTSSGVSTHKVEIVVNGELRLEGNSTNRVIMQPTVLADTATWYGIRVRDSGRLFMDNAVVKNAYCGADIQTVGENQDTVMDTRFDNCFMYGVYSGSTSYPYLYLDTFTSSTDAPYYGVYVDAEPAFTGTQIYGCRFQNLKYPVYAVTGGTNVSGCWFQRDFSSAVATAAITSHLNASVNIQDSRILDYRYGVRVGVGTQVTITACRIKGWGSNPPVGNMINAIVSDTALIAANCKVRTCCIGPTESSEIYWRSTRYGSIIDLGTAQDEGHNNFFAYWLGPYPVINNTTTVQIPARRNYWDPIFAPLANWLNPARVDTTGAYRLMDLNCEDAPPPQTKPVDTALSPAPSQSFAVDQNFPNPFNPSTRISFTIPAPSRVKVEVFNTLGQIVRMVVEGDFGAGYHVVEWDGTSVSGAHVSSGIYFYRVTAGNNISTRKMILLK